MVRLYINRVEAMREILLYVVKSPYADFIMLELRRIGMRRRIHRSLFGSTGALKRVRQLLLLKKISTNFQMVSYSRQWKIRLNRWKRMVLSLSKETTQFHNQIRMATSHLSIMIMTKTVIRVIGATCLEYTLFADPNSPQVMIRA